MIEKQKWLRLIGDKNSEILILGSFPSKVSIEKNQYYANKSNRFWNEIIKPIFNNNKCFIGEIDEEIYASKIKCLLINKIALSDVFSTKIEKNKLDTSMDKNIDTINSSKNNLIQILNDYKNIKKIIFNGKTARENFDSQNFKISRQIKLITVLSTSGANRRWGNGKKLYDDWIKAFYE
ncbi:MAG: DNA-deoxyinosine glycosylase [Mycoplasmataceae bacterium]|nr:DNA-deoxyinosine glycosylase [Mycoplasmataceae bacterium]